MNEIEPPFTGKLPVSTPRQHLAEIHATLSECRPDLKPDCERYRGALLMLLIQKVGFNVDRLVRRTGLPREFVARGVRRLIDNGWMAQGDSASAWSERPAECRRFWLDVEVLLGLAQRRVNENGEPEWAPVGEWVKDYEYQGARSAELAIHNEYRKITRHDPEPLFVEDEPRDESPAMAARSEMDEVFTVHEPQARTRPVQTPGFLGSVGDDELLGGEDPRELQRSAVTNDAGLLVDDWTGANWLS